MEMAEAYIELLKRFWWAPVIGVLLVAVIIQHYAIKAKDAAAANAVVSIQTANDSIKQCRAAIEAQNKSRLDLAAASDNAQQQTHDALVKLQTQDDAIAELQKRLQASAKEKRTDCTASQTVQEIWK